MQRPRWQGVCLSTANISADGILGDCGVRSLTQRRCERCLMLPTCWWTGLLWKAFGLLDSSGAGRRTNASSTCPPVALQVTWFYGRRTRNSLISPHRGNETTQMRRGAGIDQVLASFRLSVFGQFPVLVAKLQRCNYVNDRLSHGEAKRVVIGYPSWKNS